MKDGLIYTTNGGRIYITKEINEYDVEIEYDIVPPTVETAIRFGIGKRKLLTAIRYLERSYGSQELDAVELLEAIYQKSRPE